MSKMFLAMLVLSVGIGQAWDSNAFEAEGVVQAMVVVALLIPAMAIAASRDLRIRGGAVAAGTVLIWAARFVSDTPMPGLALAVFLPGALALLEHLRALSPGRVTNAQPHAGAEPRRGT